MKAPQIFTKLLEKSNPDIEDSTYIPEFLNTRDKYNECVRSLDTSPKFDEVFHKLLCDDSLTFNQVMGIMTTLENDVMLVHNNKYIISVLPLIESLTRYMLAQRIGVEQNTEQPPDYNETCRSEEGFQDNQKPDETKTSMTGKLDKKEN